MKNINANTLLTRHYMYNPTLTYVHIGVTMHERELTPKSPSLKQEVVTET